jgi:hypothetical protein
MLRLRLLLSCKLIHIHKCQKLEGADGNSGAFWKELAKRFAGNEKVIFSIMNEVNYSTVDRTLRVTDAEFSI